ncbi:MAG: hypothetical protein FH753_04355 [Firmicutes bacterium]|nr:hypothetical protein [Bacillota bacterium]
MFDIKISKELKEISKNVTLGCVKAKVDIEKSDENLLKEIERVINITKGIDIDEINELLQIKEIRNVYKSLGKDPSRYRASSESLLRRIIKDKGLYRINNIVDINNLLSISSFYSVGTYDIDKLKPPIIFTYGKDKDTYDAIGKGNINIENLPVFKDEIGYFGSPTSDSKRSMIKNETKNILMMIISFGDENVEKYLEYAKKLLVRYANAEDIEMKIVT